MVRAETAPEGGSDPSDSDESLLFELHTRSRSPSRSRSRSPARNHSPHRSPSPSPPRVTSPSRSALPATPSSPLQTLGPHATENPSPSTPLASVRRSPRINLREPSIAEQLRMKNAADAAPRRTRAQVQAQRARKAEERELTMRLFGVGDDDSVEEDAESDRDDEDFEPGEDDVEEDEAGGNDGEEEAQHSVEGSNSNTPTEPGSSEIRPGHVSSPTDVAVPPPKRIHASWAEWQTYLDAYAETTLQVIVTELTYGWAEKDRRVRRTKKFKEGRGGTVPPEWNPFARTYICTHGWRAKKKQPGTGERPRQHIRCTNCPFKFTVQARPVNKRDEKGPWRLVVSRGSYVHNHPINPETYATYPIARGIVDPIVEAKVDGMLTVGAKRSKIYDFLLEQGENVFKRDIDNMVSNHVTAVSSADDDDATAIEVAKFAAAEEGNLVSIAETAAGETGVLTMATAMKRGTFPVDYIYLVILPAFVFSDHMMAAT